MRALHRDLHLERARSCGGERLQNGRRSRMHEMHGLHQCLSQRCSLLRVWNTNDCRGQTKIETDPAKLFTDLAGRNLRGTDIPGEFPQCPRRLRSRSVSDVVRLRLCHYVSGPENMEAL